MIASLTGKLESSGDNFVIINVNGVGFQVFVPTSVLSDLLGINTEVKLYTHLQVREDNLSLYGFAASEELWLFETMLGVTGIGPKLALALLSAMPADQLAATIATGNADLLTTVPGIGKKTAGRIILELKDKVGAGWTITPTTPPAPENADVLAALIGLGYSAAEASRAVFALPAGKQTLEEKVRLALQFFGGK
ncbi:MAG: Holliday junction branch migration protein RuvA [Dehalococcoidales bacterium]|nr:Holliday junction branch migration protein RuvA [Dehalococcoidales bacterium]